MGPLELLGIASGRAFYVASRNTFYVTALYRAKGYEGTLTLSLEHTAAEFFSPGTLPESQAPAVREFLRRHSQQTFPAKGARSVTARYKTRREQ